MAVRNWKSASVMVLVALALLASLTFTSPTSAVAAGGSSSFVGLSTHTFWLSEADVRAEMSALAAGGVGWAREDFRWDLLEPSKGVFDWRRSDAVMAGAAAAGVDVL